MKLIWLYSFLLITTFNSKAQELLNIEEKKTIILEIQQMFNNYHNDIIKDGLEAELKYLDSSSDFFWVPPSYKSVLDYNTVKTIITNNSKAINFIEFSWETIKIYPLTNKIANYSGIVECVKVDTTNTPNTFRILESGTLIKRNNGWKFLNGQSRNIP